MLTDVLVNYAKAWREDEARLRAEGAAKGCEKCVVAAEVYGECAAQLEDILAHVQKAA